MSNFEPPPKKWSILATVGGVATAVIVIASLESLSSYFHKTDSASGSPATAAMLSESERLLAYKNKQQAAACKFNQSMALDRGMTFETKTFSSQAMGQPRSYGLVLPPDYEKNPQKRYPVIVLLHGGHGDAGGWQACAAITEVLYKLYRSGKLPPSIVVTPDGNDLRGSSARWDPDYFDGKNGRVATLIGSDLVQEIKSQYRVLDDPDFWAMGGLSSGGWGALNIGLRYLDQFHILFSHSGYFEDASGSENSPIELVKKISSEQQQALKIYLDAGASDKEFLASTEQFHQTLQQLNVDHEFHMFSGGHGTKGKESGWYYWQEHLADSLSYVGAQWLGNTATTSPVDIASLDAQFAPSSDKEMKSKSSDSKTHNAAGATVLTAQELETARRAWIYFQHNWNDKTGLINSADGFESVTLWDQAAAIAALVSAKELDLVSEAEFNPKMTIMLKTLATLPLYKNELPNKVYNSRTLLPVDYGQPDKRKEIGWSAIDLGRMALWLKIVGSKYPQLQSQTKAVWQSWNVGRLVNNGQLYGTTIVQGKEQHNQEGRLGYESYAAYGLKLWGLEVNQALDTQSNVAFVNLYGQDVPYDQRDYKTSGANNYVLSEPYILDGIETGFQALPRAYADRVLAAQEARYQATKQLTAMTEDNLDRAPYFAYNTLFVNGEAWATITDTATKMQ